MLILPATADTIYGFMAEAEAAPEELSAIANVMPAPPMPFLPPEQHGRLVIFALLAHAGDVDAGTRAVAPFQALAEPVADMVRPMRYPELFQGPGDEGEFHPGRDRAARCTSTASTTPQRETIVEQLQLSKAMMAATQLRVLGGAAARVPVGATAYAHRQSRIMVNVAALFESPEQTPEHEPWVVGLADALRQDDTAACVLPRRRGRGANPGRVPGGDLGPARRGQATLRPTNLFRLNQNIPPG